MKYYRFLFHLIVMLVPSVCKAVTTPLLKQAYKAYSPYKESFRYFWYTLSQAQQKKLQKDLMEHKDIYLTSKKKNIKFLAQKKIRSGFGQLLFVPALSVVLGALTVIILKDYQLACQTARAFIATFFAGIGCSAFICGFIKIIKGLHYDQRLEKRKNRDQILLQAIGIYEQESY